MDTQTDTEVVSGQQTADGKVAEVVGNAVFMVDPEDDDMTIEEWPVNGGYGNQGAYLSEPVPQARDDASGPITTDFFGGGGEWKGTVIGKTPGGKEVQVVKNPAGMGYLINFRSGGELPRELDGMFTKYDYAESHARLWLNEQHAKAASQEAKS